MFNYKKWTPWAKDVTERALWTGAQAGVAVAIVEVSSIKEVWAIPIGMGLAWLKGVIAKHVGNPQSASTVHDI